MCTKITDYFFAIQVQLTKRIGNIPNETVRKAEVCIFFEDFTQAEKLYLEADRK